MGIVPTAEECICCCEIRAVVNKMETTGVLCNTEHEGFDAVCVNVWVLQAAYYQYKQQYEHSSQNTLHK